MNKTKPATKTDRSFAKKWAPELEKDGFVQVSNFFLENYHRLKPYPLTHGEAMFVVHLMQFKWDEAKPYPAYKTIAERMVVSDKTARRFAAKLQGKGYLQREMRVAQTNRFDMSRLMTALVDLKKAQHAAKQDKEEAQ